MTSTNTAKIRKARKDAEHAALQALQGTLVGSAGDLGMAHAAHAEATAHLRRARDRADMILADARTAARQLMAEVERGLSDAATAYAAAYAAAKDAGWTPAQLRAMGYAKPSRTRVSAPSDDRQADSDPNATDSPTGLTTHAESALRICLEAANDSMLTRADDSTTPATSGVHLDDEEKLSAR